MLVLAGGPGLLQRIGCPGLLHRIGRHFASTQRLSALHPPGLLRLGLDPVVLEDVCRAAHAGGPAAALGCLVRSGSIRSDEAQQRGAQELQKAWEAAHAHTRRYALWKDCHSAWELECVRIREEHAEQQAALKRETEEKSSSASRGGSVENADETVRSTLVLPSAPDPPKLDTHGCYLWGDVGRGKSFLMDIFTIAFQNLPSNLEGGSFAVRRAHFHEFMYELHRDLHKVSARDGLSTVVSKVASGHPAILCFDEFQITNIADAALIARLFRELFLQDVMLIMTSNRAPQNLYTGGLNHGAHLPAFSDALLSCMSVHHLDSEIDYRKLNHGAEAAAASAGAETSSVSPALGDFIVTQGTTCEGVPEAQFTAAFKEAVGSQDTAPSKLPVAWGRTLQCGVAAPGVAKFNFEELCAVPLSAEDYLALVVDGRVHTFVISGVPRFTLRLHNEARRFTNLVDCLYENQCRLICTAASPPEELLVGMEVLCTAEIKPVETPDSVKSELPMPRRTHKHGDVTFETSASSPCRPDSFATAEADAEAGTSVVHLQCDASDTADGVVGVMPAAIESLRESGFAARRCVSRLLEMSTLGYRSAHDLRWHV